MNGSPALLRSSSRGALFTLEPSSAAKNCANLLDERNSHGPGRDAENFGEGKKCTEKPYQWGAKAYHKKSNLLTSTSKPNPIR